LVNGNLEVYPKFDMLSPRIALKEWNFYVGCVKLDSTSYVLENTGFGVLRSPPQFNIG
jgi:hypothetical protein